MGEVVSHTLLEMMIDERVPNGLGGRWYGCYPAQVTDINDPNGQGRVKVSLPWAPDTASERYEAWARLATMMGGNNRGTWFIPDVNDEVLIMFEGGDPRCPCVIGGLWNGQDAPPELRTGLSGRSGKVFDALPSRRAVTLMPSSRAVAST